MVGSDDVNEQLQHLHVKDSISMLEIRNLGSEDQLSSMRFLPLITLKACPTLLKLKWPFSFT